MTQQPHIPVVALVCSAGGLDAMGRILAGLPPTVPAAVIALRHSHPHAVDQLPTVLQRQTALPVRRAADGDRLECGRVYVAPSGHHMLVTPDGTVSLIVSGEPPPCRPSADLLLTSLALAAGPRAVAVVLSGHGNDGATGATAIHHRGGVVVASDAATSTVFAMPAATIDRDEIIDDVLAVDKIAARLVDIVADMTPIAGPDGPEPGARGADLLASPGQNKDAAFSTDERAVYGLRGLLPHRVASIEQQVELELEHLRRKTDDLERYIGLTALQDRNETLFHRLLSDHLEELAPVVYTPTVGDACRQFSHILRRPRGLWVTPDDIDRIPELLDNVGRPGIRLIVATDNERILGLGDLGAGGMGIPIGKLALYTAGAGVHPGLTLPVSLDCGTDNAALLSDPLYLGYPQPRLRGPAYDAFVEAFVEAVVAHYPDVLLQWEDLKQHNAIRVLERYRHRVASFNDDIQGTAAVVVAGLLAALQPRRESLGEQRIVLMGAGAAGTGIARLIETVIREREGRANPRHSVLMLDSHGLVFDGREHVDDDKRPFALPGRELVRYGFEPAPGYDLETVVRRVAPTVLIGTTGVAGAFTETAIRDMAAQVPAPIVMPLSNPTANAEARPADVLAWSEGRAIVATGSPSPPVAVAGGVRTIGQANNVFVFPGVGLGTIAARAREVTDRMFLVAATTLAGLVSADRVAAGAIYPPLSRLRTISRAIALAVAREAREAGVARLTGDIEAAVEAAMWAPSYGTDHAAESSHAPPPAPAGGTAVLRRRER